MNKSKVFQYALLSVLLAPLVGSVVWGIGRAVGQAVNSTGVSTSKGGTTNVTVTTPPNDVVAGPTNLNSIGSVPVSAMGSGSTGIDIRGTFTGLTALFEGSVDGTNFISIPCVVPATGAIVTGATAAGTWTCQSAGYQIVRARLSAIATGTATITLNASAGSNQPPIGTQGTSTNITAVASTAVGAGSGASTAGTLRVVMATDSPGIVPLGQTTMSASVPVAIASNQTAVPVTMTAPTNITPVNCSSTITTGGTAQNAFTASASRTGFIIANIDTSEVMWISFTGTAVAAATASYPLAPATVTTFANLNSFSSPQGFAINTALSVVAATTGHKYSCTVW